MKLIITEKAKNIIQKKGGIFTIGYTACASWAGPYKILWSGASSKSESNEDYDRYEQDGITVYIDKFLETSDRVEIELKSNLPLFGPAFKVKGLLV